MSLVHSRRVAVALVLVVAMYGATALGEGRGMAETSRNPYVRLRSADIDAVRWMEESWAQRFELCRRAMIPGMLKALENSENAAYLDNFRVAPRLKQDPHCVRTIQNIADILRLQSFPATPGQFF